MKLSSTAPPSRTVVVRQRASSRSGSGREHDMFVELPTAAADMQQIQGDDEDEKLKSSGYT